LSVVHEIQFEHNAAKLDALGFKVERVPYYPGAPIMMKISWDTAELPSTQERFDKIEGGES